MVLGLKPWVVSVVVNEVMFCEYVIIQSEGHVPHTGLFASTNAEASLVNSSGSEVMLVTHHLVKS